VSEVHGDRGPLSERSEGKFIRLDDELYEYVVAHGAREDRALEQVRETTAELGSVSVMQVSPDEGALLTMLAQITGARRAIELGTFTGYSAICIARGLAADGVLVACELDPERANTARRNFAEAGVGDRVDVRVGPARETLEALLREGVEPFDFAFLDADKVSYLDYYEACLELLRPGGLMAIDNTLRAGGVLDPANAEEGTSVVAELNDRIVADERVDVAMLTVADGVTLARKR
jgi:predicted O-methyltransferase YrrM